MPPRQPVRHRHKTPPPGVTGQEMLYLRFLSEKQVPVTVKMRDGESVYGWIEYFDDRMIRLTREGKPNLFIYKNQIRTISESSRHIEARRRERNRSAQAPPPGPVAVDGNTTLSIVPMSPVSAYPAALPPDGFGSDGSFGNAGNS